MRGDGRPDYRYHAHVLYADAVSPRALGVSGGVVTVQGTGFAPDSPARSEARRQLTRRQRRADDLAAPAFPDGPQNITITDPVSGASSTMTDAVTYGAAATDNIVLLGTRTQSAHAVGTQATNPVSVRVLAADGVTPVGGATIGWSASNGLQLSACGGASSCSVVSDQSGNAATWLTPGRDRLGDHHRDSCSGQSTFREIGERALSMQPSRPPTSESRRLIFGSRRERPSAFRSRRAS